MKFRVTSVNTAGNDRVNVSFTQVNEDTDGNPATVGFGSGNLLINLPSEDAKAYWPDQEYDLALTAV